jgi:hypothetical protein
MENRLKSCVNSHQPIAVAVTVMVLSAILPGCTAFDPQSAAQQYAPSYYNAPYSSLTPQQKMQLEDHLANQSNQAWRTTASAATGLGYLTGGVGLLLFSARH